MRTKNRSIKSICSFWYNDNSDAYNHHLDFEFFYEPIAQGQKFHLIYAVDEIEKFFSKMDNLIKNHMISEGELKRVNSCLFQILKGGLAKVIVEVELGKLEHLVIMKEK